MDGWQALIGRAGGRPLEEIRQQAAAGFDRYGVYAPSMRQLGGTLFFLARREEGKALVLAGSREYFSRFTGQEQDAAVSAKVCPLDHGNCLALRALFPFMNPVAIGERKFSLGLGDRLGVATPGHIAALAGTGAFPVLAQQSVRELTLTGRTFAGVLDDACWGVFQAGYEGGFGADADHLKTDDEVRAGLSAGYTMITLDCSEHIDNTPFSLDGEALCRRYGVLPASARQALEAQYLNRSFALEGGGEITFTPTDLMRLALVYGRALEFIAHVYHDLIAPCGRRVDFEVSIDETAVPTSPQAHYLIASEMKRLGVRADSLAPRFCGEFQKGIDYIGDAGAFARELIMHQRIAQAFGYRLSIHSGSDKFRVFPAIGRHTGLHVHVKTAGTNWLEAVRLIAGKNPGLYRRMHAAALAGLDEAKKYYHIGARRENIPDIDSMSDEDLPKLMEQDDARQALHITYGVLLRARDEKTGKSLFRDEIYATLHQYESQYHAGLVRHIGRHLTALGAK